MITFEYKVPRSRVIRIDTIKRFGDFMESKLYFLSTYFRKL